MQLVLTRNDSALLLTSENVRYSSIGLLVRSTSTYRVVVHSSVQSSAFSNSQELCLLSPAGATRFLLFVFPLVRSNARLSDLITLFTCLLNFYALRIALLLIRIPRLSNE